MKKTTISAIGLALFLLTTTFIPKSETIGHEIEEKTQLSSISNNHIAIAIEGMDTGSAGV